MLRVKCFSGNVERIRADSVPNNRVAFEQFIYGGCIIGWLWFRCRAMRAKLPNPF